MSKETLHSSIQEKEAKVLGREKIADKSENKLVDEQKVHDAITAMESKLTQSPLSQKYKDVVAKKLTEATDKWKSDVDAFKAAKGPKYEARFKELFGQILKDFEEFEKKPEVKEVFEYIEPLYAKKDAVCGTMNLPVFDRGVAGWRDINSGLGSIGFSSEKIAGIQKLLGIHVDGEIGPQAILEINKRVYEQSFEVKLSTESMSYEVEGPEKFGLPEEKAFEVAASADWQQIDVDALSALKIIWKTQEGAKTVAELENLELQEREIRENAIKLKEDFVASLKALEDGKDAPEGEVPDASFLEFKNEMPEINNRLGFLGIHLYEALYLKAYKETSVERRISAISISAHIDKLVDAVERCPVYPDATVEASDGAVKSALMALVKGYEVEGAATIDRVIGEIEKTDVEISEMPENFAALNKEIGLPIATLAIYYKAYMQIPEAQRISITEIREKLRFLRGKFLDGARLKSTTLPAGAWDQVDGMYVVRPGARATEGHDTKGRAVLDGPEEGVANMALIEAFGRLISGQRENLISNDVLANNIVEAQRRYLELSEERKEAQEKLTHFEERRQGQVDWLAKTVEENPGWYNFWTPSNEKLINQAIEHLALYEGFIKQNREKIREVEGKMQALLKFSLVNQHELLKNTGQDTRDMLLSMHDTLGDQVPEELKPEVAKALENYAADPAASEVLKLVYAGKYDEALKLLAQKNDERTKIPGLKGAIGEHDILNAYRKWKDTPAVAKVIAKLKLSNSFAAQKVKEGYIPIPMKGAEDKRMRSVFMVKQHADGSLSYIWVDREGNQFGTSFPEGSPGWRMGQEHTLTPEKIAGMDKSDKEMRESLQKIISQKPSFKAVNKASEDINHRFAPLQSLFQKTLKGNKTENFVSLAKQFAREIKGAAGIKELRSNLVQARADLSFLKSFGKAGMTDEFEAQILKMEKQMSQVARLVEGNKIEAFCDLILSSDFESDSFGRWIIKDALPFLGAILAATAAIVITFTTFGVGGVAGLALMAGVGTVAGMAGHELATVGSHYLGKSVYGDDFSNKTMLGKYLTDEKVYNPQTGAWEDIKGVDLAKVYGKQFVVAFVTTFALLGLGQLAGTFLSKFAAAHGASEGFKGMAARLLTRIPKLRRHEVDLMNQKGFGNMMKKLGREFLQETGEEGSEDAAKRVHPALGFMVSLYHCLNGKNVAYKFGKYKLVGEGAFKNGENEALTTWSYDAAQRAEFEAAVRAEYGKQGFAVKVETDGTIVAETSLRLKDGTVMKNKMVFKPTTESLSARQLLREGMDGNKSEIERIYGVRQTGNNSFEFSEMSPEGKITLANYLQRKGFVIVGDPLSGDFTAVKGAETVTFKQGARTKVEGDHDHDHDHEHDEHGGESEVETKYRLKEVPDSVKDQAGSQIHQIYLDGTNPAIIAMAKAKAPDLDVSQLKEIRVRKKTGPDGKVTNYLTVKGGGTLARYEKEVTISDTEFDQFVAAGKTKGEVKKTRRIVDLGDGLKLEIDEYHGAIKGLVTAEVEFTPGKFTPAQIEARVRAALPGMDVTDVTASLAIKNNALAVTGSLAELETNIGKEGDHDHDHEHHDHDGENLSQEEIVALRKKLLDSKTEEGKKIDALLKGKTVEVNGQKLAIEKRLLTPSTLIELAKTGKLKLSSYDLYLHKHMGKLFFAHRAKHSNVPDGEHASMLAKVEQGMEIFLKSHQEISVEGREMVTAFMSETVDQVMAGYVAKSRAEGREVDPEAVALLKQKILEAAIDQHIDNPPQYVSHGFDHSLRVMDHVKTVAKSDPKVIENMAKQWGISYAQAELFAMLNGVCHDFGYPDVAQDLAKSQHAVTGAHRFIMEIGPSLAKAAGLDLTNPKHRDLLANFARCIQCHSADKHEHDWKASNNAREALILDTKITVTYRINGVDFTEEILCEKKNINHVKKRMKEYFKKRFNYDLQDGDFSEPVFGAYSGRHFDIPGSSKEHRTPGGVEYRGAELIDPGDPAYDPLLAMTRYADNLDMDPSRFSEFQRSQLFTSVYTRMGAERAIGDVTFSDHLAGMLGTDASLESMEAVLHFESKDAVIYEGEIYNLLEKIVLGEAPSYAKTGQLYHLLKLLDKTSVKIGRYGKDSPNDSEAEKMLKERIKEFREIINKGDHHLLADKIKYLRNAIGRHIFEDETSTEPVFTSEQEKAKYEADKAMVKKYLETVDEKSFRHFGGCKPIESTTIEKGVVKIRMRQDVILAYKNLVAKEKGPDGAEIVVPIAIYQVWRAVEAYQSLTINGEKAKFEITVGDKTFHFDPEARPDGTRRDSARASADFVAAFRNWQRGNL